MTQKPSWAAATRLSQIANSRARCLEVVYCRRAKKEVVVAGGGIGYHLRHNFSQAKYFP